MRRSDGSHRQNPLVRAAQRSYALRHILSAPDLRPPLAGRFPIPWNETSA